MKTETRRALKQQDKFIETAHSGLDWLQQNRSRALWLGLVAVIVIAAIVGSIIFHHERVSAAETAFGIAMNVYSEPIAEPGQTQEAGGATFASEAERAKAANQKFTEVADRYSSLQAGKNARYFAGVSAVQMGDNVLAEKDLRKAAGPGDKELAALSNLALAGLYRQTNRIPEAIQLYKQLIAHPTTTVPATTAQLALADLYETTNPDEAQRIYAQLKSDKGPAGQIATQKLGSK